MAENFTSVAFVFQDISYNKTWGIQSNTLYCIYDTCVGDGNFSSCCPSLTNLVSLALSLTHTGSLFGTNTQSIHIYIVRT